LQRFFIEIANEEWRLALAFLVIFPGIPCLMGGMAGLFVIFFAETPDDVPYSGGLTYFD